MKDRIFLGLLFTMNFLATLGFASLAIFYTLRAYTVRTDLIVMIVLGLFIVVTNGLLLWSKFEEVLGI